MSCRKKNPATSIAAFLYLRSQTTAEAPIVTTIRSQRSGSVTFSSTKVSARHEGVRIEQKLIVAEVNPDGKSEQQDDGENPDKAPARRSRQQPGFPARSSDVLCGPLSNRAAVAEFFTSTANPWAVAQKTRAHRIARREYKSERLRKEG